MNTQKRVRIALITPIEDDIPVQVSAYKAWMPRYGSVAVAQALKDAGYEIRHYCEHSGSVIDWDYVYSCDYVCFSLMTFCAYRGYRQGKAASGISYHDLPQCGGNFSFVVDYGGEDKYGCRAKNNSYNRNRSFN